MSEQIIAKQHGKSFEEIYGANIFEVYTETIDKFFRDELLDSYGFFTRKDGVQVSKGFIWTADHGHFATLTIEPMDGSQYEIAVRMPHPSFLKDGDRFYKFCGYSICCIPFVMIGKDTGGH